MKHEALSDKTALEQAADLRRLARKIYFLDSGATPRYQMLIEAAQQLERRAYTGNITTQKRKSA